MELLCKLAYLFIRHAHAWLDPGTVQLTLRRPFHVCSMEVCSRFSASLSALVTVALSFGIGYYYAYRLILKLETWASSVIISIITPGPARSIFSTYDVVISCICMLPLVYWGQLVEPIKGVLLSDFCPL